MILLALDCSHTKGSICLQRESDVLFQDSWEIEKSHAELLPVFIANALDQSKLSLEEIDALAVTTGPGSFTGIRIAINTIKTLSYAMNKKIYTATSLQVIAHANAPKKQNLVVAVDAHSDLYYLQKFSKQLSSEHGDWQCSSGIEVVKRSGLNQMLTTSDCLFAVDAIPSAAQLSDYIFKNKNSLRALSWNDLEPLYVRLSAPEEKASAPTHPNN